MIDKEKNYQLKGVAILLMLFHHLFAFSDRIPFGNDVLAGNNILRSIGFYSKICVSFYMFLGGYVLYKNYNNSFKTIIQSVKKLYIKYWKIFIIFVPIGLLLFNNQMQYAQDINMSNRFYNLGIIEIVLNFIGVISTINREWWFLQTFVFCLILGFVYLKIFNKKSNLILELIFITIVFLLLRYLIPNILSQIDSEIIKEQLGTLFKWNITLFLTGIVFAKYKIYEMFARYYKNTFVNIILLIVLLIIRKIVSMDLLDIILVPFIMIEIVNIFSKSKTIKSIFEYFGKNSTNMWLCHTFYCYYFYFFVKIVYFTNNPIVIYGTLLAITLLTSIIIDLFYNIISRKIFKNRIVL